MVGGGYWGCTVTSVSNTAFTVACWNNTGGNLGSGLPDGIPCSWIAVGIY
jgi:hypothetical protein